jgi:hypothetical protein
VLTSPNFSGTIGSSLVFQVKIDLSLYQADTITLTLFYSDFEIYSESYLLASGQHSIIVMKNVSCISGDPQALTIKIKPQSEVMHEIFKVDYFVWGIASASQSKVNMSASTLGSKLGISMISDNQLFMSEYTSLPNEIGLSDLVYKVPAIDASVVYITQNNDEVLHVFRVDSLKNLNHSVYSSLLNEELVDTNVTSVSSSRIYESEEVLVAYIKNGRPYAKVFLNGTFSETLNLPVPDTAVCERVSVFNCTDMYALVIVTTSSGANYLCMSGKVISNCIENISVELGISFS